MTLSEIEPATFRFLAQCLTQLRHAVHLVTFPYILRAFSWLGHKTNQKNRIMQKGMTGVCSLTTVTHLIVLSHCIKPHTKAEIMHQAV
jgi:hypothetical protein